MKIFVLTTIINGRKNFIASQMSNRSDNKKIVNYTTDANYAKDFESIEAAEKFIDHIVNPRQYTAESMEVNEAQRAKLFVEEDIK